MTHLVSAIVLAGGSSRRMGTPKQLLRVGGRNLLDRTLGNVRGAFHRSIGAASIGSVEPGSSLGSVEVGPVGEIILVLGFAAEQVQREVSTEGLKIAMNPAYAEGMASSLRAGIAAVDPRAEAAFIVLADQPCVRSATLQKLIEHHRLARPQIVIPTYRGFRGNPVLLDRSVFPEIMEITGDIGCRSIFGGHNEHISKLDVDDVGILLDVDTVEDLERVAAACGQESGAGALALLPELENRGVVTDAAGTPPPELVVVGRDAVAKTLMRLGSLLRFTTTLVDPLLTLKEVPEADRVLHRLDLSVVPAKGKRYIVVASRGQFDEEALEQALQSDAVYVGLLANKKRARELASSLERKGVPGDRLARMRASAGLDIGAESPEEIALSIMAEIVATKAAGS
jgi:molybdenum cofactor cytidylyltransferase